ncbi:class II D-tagatose-bisphosphate aldolase, non-catalytic subunit [Catenisphaera adipataccumulans]|uniref:D-tagatose-1,6-bisphosphate aldolase subunit GatZ/KbaZ n=1 Tax=Catenisphaera adipataccumulans TaxID=700500 RepID=A0A7W8CVP3_9FIRM|nr:class II D-tagatose-bisphosphate aldolase, non-catalytic subunit [Catenisphaera adipataccumulans]MBB5182445.1 D-tagatose-1,6-bisphosphate aldolase subunit GatZ/KbaZ [Catenisphaera adipataccumulans]
MENALKNIVKLQKAGNPVGICSVCTGNAYVIEAALERAKETDSVVLIESTANQVDQNGGYTGMKPADFYQMVYDKADAIGLDRSRVFLGGDHLGPLTVTDLPEKEAMAYARRLVHDYVAAGYTKIHIDTSMKVADDDPDTRLSDETISRRGAELAKVCEEAYQELKKTRPDAVRPVYIVGSEVPIPGGAQDPKAGMQVTRVEDFKATYKAFEKAFADQGLTETWKDVMAIVVQPGVEEKDAGCEEYDRKRAAELMASIKDFPNLVFEGHSTDYQTKYKLRELVEDGVGILKVGPGMTFAMREALFALAYMEDQQLNGAHEAEKSHFIDVLDKAMLADPKYWKKYYHGTDDEIAFKRKFSFSDRSRYYMPNEAVDAAKNKMLENLRKYGINLSTLSQFMPLQYTKVREGTLANDPEALIKDKIKYTIDEYLFATRQEQLVK